ncbi:hypothetical protein K3495_g15326, partial [Podosphaera aphanis]
EPDKDPKDTQPGAHVLLDSPFHDPELEQLWQSALSNNERYWEARRIIQSDGRIFPNEWGLQWQVSECSLDHAGRLLWRDRLWIPYYEPLRTRLIQLTHDSSMTGHPGHYATRDLISRFCAWPGLSEDVRRFVGNCHTCGKGKFWKEQKRGLLKPLPIPERTWQELAIDFVVKLPKTKRGNTLIMGVTDRLSKQPILIPLSSEKASTMAEQFIVHIYAHHGLPRYYI